MLAQSPFSFLSGLAAKGPGSWQAPPWAVDEIQQRLLLLLNHVLMQEAEAQARLVRVKGRTVLLGWRQFSMGLVVTAAGLLDRVPELATPDLRLTLTETSPLSLAQAALRGAKPPVFIEGDVLLAAEVQWLVDHVRWDIEEDLSRLIGDVPAQALGQAARQLLKAVREFAGRSGEPGP
jgi:ubiquinone biosynthesis protein UbiJ